jgi:hypothetical protein
MIVYVDNLKIRRDSSRGGNFGNVSWESIFMEDECKKATPRWGIRQAVSIHASSRGMYIDKNKFIKKEEILNIFSRFSCGEFGFL